MRLYEVTNPASDYDELESAVIYADSETEAKEMFMEVAQPHQRIKFSKLEVEIVERKKGVVHQHIHYG